MIPTPTVYGLFRTTWTTMSPATKAIVQKCKRRNARRLD